MANMPEMGNPSNPPKIVLDYASPLPSKAKKHKYTKPPGRWLAVLAAVAGVRLLITVPLIGFPLTRDEFIVQNPIPILVWIFCGIAWISQSLSWYLSRRKGAARVVPVSRFRF